MTLPERVLALHRALGGEHVPHAFGGAIALAYYTLDPRGTGDLDVNVFIPAASPGPALAALPKRISGRAGVEDVIARNGQVRLWWGRTPIDLFFDYAPIHSQAREHVRTVPFLDQAIPVLGPVELVVFKVMFDRTQDWADIEAMMEAAALDLEAVRSTLSTMLDQKDDRFRRLKEAVRRTGS